MTLSPIPPSSDHIEDVTCYAYGIRTNIQKGESSTAVCFEEVSRKLKPTSNWRCEVHHMKRPL